MRKILLIIGIFGVLSVGMFISGCGEDEKNCICTTEYYDEGGTYVVRTETSENTVSEDLDCDSQNGPGYNSVTGEEYYMACVGNHSD